MNNQDVAHVLDNIADMLEIKGDNPFRVRAHRRAANSIRSTSDDIGALVAESRLTDLPAVGQGLADRVAELVKTGKMVYYEELKTEVPPRVLELMRVPGLGPRKAKQIYEELAIAGIDELYEAAKTGRLRGLKGMSAKTEENIIQGVELIRSGQERMLLSEAYPLASRLRDELRRAEGVENADFAGSLRRMKETIGDIDLLASSTDPAGVTARFIELNEVDRVIAHGDTKASILTKTGLQVDLRVVKPNEYGSALQYFTGSKEHNVTLRDLAKKRGLKINEYGIFDAETDERKGGETEEEIYSMMGMKTMPPEIREDKGEIRAALDGKLPRLVRLKDIKGDLQSHSVYSDGLNKIEEMAEAAAALGYEYLAVTDHAEKLKIAGGMKLPAIKERTREIDRVNAKGGPVRLLNGIELNIDIHGEVDYPPEVLGSFDIVLASIHAGFSQPREEIMKRLTIAMENPYVQIIAHPTGRIIGRRNPYDVDIDRLFDLAASTGTVLELNSYPDRLDLKDDYAREARLAGAIGYNKHLPYGGNAAKVKAKIGIERLCVRV
jgi:DNA polymerase (family 10)